MRVAYCKTCSPVVVVAVGPFDPNPGKTLADAAEMELKRKEIRIEEERKFGVKNPKTLEAANKKAVGDLAAAKANREAKLARSKVAVAAKHRVKGETHVATVIELPDDPLEFGEKPTAYLARLAKTHAAKLV